MDEVTITHLGRHGDGVGEGPVFAPLTLPGEVVTGTRDGTDLRDVRIVTPSEDRVRPPCPHFKACGGCALQHAADPLVAGWKEDVVRGALAQNGVDAPLRPILTSPTHSRRRAKLAARRTKSGAMAGFHGRASGTIVDVKTCPLLVDALQSAPALARDLAIEGASRKAELSVQCTATLQGLDVAVSGGKPLDAPSIEALSAIAKTHGAARVFWGGELVAQRAAPRHQIGKAQVTLPPGAFLQATAHGEAHLQACVAEASKGAKRVLDLFAGCGTFALALADTAPVHAVEGEAAMIDALQQAANHAALTFPVTSEVRDLFRNPLLPDELSRFDAVVLDPPRAGATAQVAQIAKAQVPVVAYVSCDPATFARDAGTLIASGYVLEWVQPVDQFRWSTHVELAARFALPHMLSA